MGIWFFPNLAVFFRMFLYGIKIRLIQERELLMSTIICKLFHVHLCPEFLYTPFVDKELLMFVYSSKDYYAVSEMHKLILQ